MELQLFINGIDFSDAVKSPGTSQLGMGWTVTQKCYGYDELEIFLDFGFYVQPEVFKGAEIWLQEKNSNAAAYNTPSGEEGTFHSNERGSGEKNIFGINRWLYPDDPSPAGAKRPRRLFGGVVLRVRERTLDSQPIYPILRLNCAGYGWRTTNTILFGDPRSSFWIKQTDSQIIMKTDSPFSIDDHYDYSDAGFAPSLLDWFDYKHIARLGQQFFGRALVDTSPGNMREISAATKRALKNGFAAIGKNSEYKPASYLSGSDTFEIYAALKEVNRLMNSLSLWSGAVWWVGGYKELNYARPRDLPEFVIETPPDVGPYTDQRPHNLERDVSIEHIATAIALMNTSVWSPNTDYHRVTMTPGTTQHQLGEFNHLLPKAIPWDNPLPGVYRVHAGGNGVSYYKELKIITNPSVAPYSVGPYPDGVAPRPIEGQSGWTANRYDEEPFEYIWYNAATNTFSVPVSHSFVENEELVFYHETIMVNSGAFRSITLFHDPQIDDHAGLYIKPVYSNDSLTVWDSLRKVTELLSAGADMDIVNMASNDDKWATMRGRIINFDSPQLRINQGSAYSTKRVSTFEFGKLRTRMDARSTPGRSTVNGKIYDIYGNVEIRQQSSRKIDWEYDPGNNPISTIVSSGAKIILHKWPVTSLITTLFGEQIDDFLQKKVNNIISELATIVEGEAELVFLSDNFPAIETLEMSLDGFEYMRDTVIDHLEQLDRAWVDQSSIIDRKFYRMINSTGNKFLRSIKGANATIQQFATATEFVTGTNNYRVTDSHSTELQRIANQIMQIYTCIRKEEDGGKWFIQSLGDPRKYYCRELKITPLSSAQQKYEAKLYREPPEAKEALHLAAQRLNGQS